MAQETDLPTNNFLSMYLSESSKSPSIRSGDPTQINNIFRDETTTYQQRHEVIGYSLSNGTVLTNGNDYIEDKYFDNENTEQRIKCLNQELLSLGLSSLYNEFNGNFELARLVNCTDGLLQRYRHNQRNKEEMEDKQKRANCDMEHLQQIQNRLKGTIKQYESNVTDLELKEEQLMQKNRNLLKQVKSERDEVKRLHSVLQHREAQYKHDVKKHEREHLKLKDRIHQLLTDRHDKKTGIKISNALQRGDKKRGVWNTTTTTARQEEELFRSVITTYEEKQKELMVENSELRNVLLDLQKYLIRLLPSSKRTNSSSLNDSHSSVGVSSGGLDNLDASGHYDDCDVFPSDKASEAHFKMPYEMVREDLIKDIKLKCKSLRDHTPCDEGSIRKSKSGEKHKEELRRLHEQVAKYREIVDQQERLLQQSLEMRSNPEDNSLIKDPGETEETELMKAERQLFREKLAHFEAERNNFTEAAIRLSKERKAFEEERATFLENQFMQLTPMNRDNRHVRPLRRAQSASIQHALNRRVLPSTPGLGEIKDSPHITPVSQRGYAVPTPSTADLYRCLGLGDEPKQNGGSPRSSGTQSSSGKTSLKSSPSTSPGRYVGKRGSLSPQHGERVAEYVEELRTNLFDDSDFF